MKKSKETKYMVQINLAGLHTTIYKMQENEDGDLINNEYDMIIMKKDLANLNKEGINRKLFNTKKEAELFIQGALFFRNFVGNLYFT